jgi:hypothetical protein
MRYNGTSNSTKVITAVAAAHNIIVVGKIIS